MNCKTKQFHAAIVIGALCLMLGAMAGKLRAAVEGVGTATATQSAGDFSFITEKPNAQLPLDLEFTDEVGNPVKLGSFFTSGRPVIVAMVYYECPMLCGLTLTGLRNGVADLKLKVGTDYQIVTVSFNPREKPLLAEAKKARYIKELGKTGERQDWENGWHFLTTPSDSNARKLGDALGFSYRYDPSTEQYTHQAAIYICTPEGRVSRMIADVNFPTDVLNDSLVHASAGQLSSPIVRLGLFCGVLHYDAATGKYVTIAKNVMRLGGALTVLVLGGFIGGFWIRDHRRQKLTRQTEVDASHPPQG